MPEPAPVRLQVVANAQGRPSHPQPQTPAAIVLISPDPAHRLRIREMVEARGAKVVTEFGVYPNYNHLASILESECDAFLIELDTDNGAALELVESVCRHKPSLTVMVYSSRPKSELLLKSMRSGAREFITTETLPADMAEALGRAVIRKAEQSTAKARGKVLVFWGAKGGSGVTTLAANLAIALRYETNDSVALVDLNPQLGDIAALLGVTPQFTIADALRDPDLVDEEFAAGLAAPHLSGISIIAAPDQYSSAVTMEARTVGKLIDAVRGRFPYVIVDAGVGLGSAAEALFQIANTIYVVSQPDLASLRNSQRFIAHLENYGVPSIELVLNRYESRRTEFDDERLTKALGAPPKWKVPNDFASARRAMNTGTPLLASGSPVAKALRRMARVACGKPPDEEPRKGLGLFGR